MLIVLYLDLLSIHIGTETQPDKQHSVSNKDKMKQQMVGSVVHTHTICSSSRASARFAAISFSFGISIFSSPFFANVMDPAVKFTCHPRYTKRHVRGAQYTAR